MKNTIAVCAAAIISFVAIFQTRADIIAGPITNPGNGHDYYLLTPDTWSASEVQAEQLGGTLAVIKNAAEQEWVLSKFGAYGDINRNLWVGLRRQWQGGPFVWVTDEKPGYSNWEHGQPDNNGGNESFVHMFGKVGDRLPGTWNDLADATSIDGAPNCGVVEVPGKSNEKKLTEKEKSLVGTWYNNGDPDQPCCIAGTENLLFAINENKDATRIIETPEGFLFSPKWKQHAEVVKDKILWSRGNWWSRKPAGYKTGEISLDKSVP